MFDPPDIVRDVDDASQPIRPNGEGRLHAADGDDWVHALAQAEDEDLDASTCDSSASPPPDPMAAARAQGPAAVCARLLLLRALRDLPGIRGLAWRPGGCLVVRLPPKPWDALVSERWFAEVDGWKPPHGLGRDARDPVVAAARARLRSVGQDRPDGPCVLTFSDVRWTDHRLDDVGAALRRGQPVHALSPDPLRMVPPDLLAAADATVTVAPPDAEVLRCLAWVLAGSEAESAEALARLQEPDHQSPRPRRSSRRGAPARSYWQGASLVLPPPLDQRPDNVTPLQVELARQVGQTAQTFLLRLADIVQRRRHAIGTAVRSGLTLEQLHGYGEAGEWARRAARDLRAHAEGHLPWSEVSRGALLVGPPGTGKTLLAQATAASAGVPLVTGSLARWQAADDGHLGTTLRAMRRCFADARAAAPCVLLVDELDSLGDRERFAPSHRDYSTQVVNALLELLDGAEPRDGVLVVGTSNNLDAIDRAILRPGRLDRVIPVGLPEAPALAAMMRLYLGSDVSLSMDDPHGAKIAMLGRLAHRQGATGAHVEQWCREARAVARAAGRTVTLADLRQVLPAPRPTLPETVLWRAAVHEAGHAVGFFVLQPAMVGAMTLDLPEGLGGVAVDHDQLDAQGLVTREDLLRLLRAMLAGRAAEVVVLGSPSSGAGGGEGSDLARATRLAMLVVGSLGLSGAPDGLVWQPTHHGVHPPWLHDPVRHARVGALLAETHTQAERLIHRYEAVVRTLAARLLRERFLEATAVRAMLSAAIEMQGADTPLVGC